MDESPDQKSPEIVRHLLIGATPALVGTMTVLIHLREPVVPLEHELVLVGLWIGLICCSLAAWLHCTIERRANRIEQLIRQERATVNKINRAVEGVHRRAQTIERQSMALGKAFIDEGTPSLNGHKGPRSLS
ncbi:hypothetical protein GCM10027447_12890 [Glycomyces halotolerans]